MHSLHPLDVDAHVAYVQERRFATARPRRRSHRRTPFRERFRQIREAIAPRWTPRQQRGSARRILEA